MSFTPICEPTEKEPLTPLSFFTTVTPFSNTHTHKLHSNTENPKKHYNKGNFYRVIETKRQLTIDMLAGDSVSLVLNKWN